MLTSILQIYLKVREKLKNENGNAGSCDKSYTEDTPTFLSPIEYSGNKNLYLKSVFNIFSILCMYIIPLKEKNLFEKSTRKFHKVYIFYFLFIFTFVKKIYMPLLLEREDFIDVFKRSNSMEYKILRELCISANWKYEMDEDSRSVDRYGKSLLYDLICRGLYDGSFNDFLPRDSYDVIKSLIISFIHLYDL